MSERRTLNKIIDKYFQLDIVNETLEKTSNFMVNTVPVDG